MGNFYYTCEFYQTFILSLLRVYRYEGMNIIIKL